MNYVAEQNGMKRKLQTVLTGHSVILKLLAMMLFLVSFFCEIDKMLLRLYYL